MGRVIEFDVVGCGIGELEGTTLLRKTDTFVGTGISYTTVVAEDAQSKEVFLVQQRDTYGSREAITNFTYPAGTRTRTPRPASS